METSGKRLALGRFLVAGQVALSLLLLIGAGLFIRTLGNLRNLNLGFRTDRILLVSLNPGLSGYTPERTVRFYSDLLERVNALPGVRSASVANSPLLGGAYIDGLSVEGHPARQGEDLGVSIKIVTPRFFETMSIPLRLGVISHRPMAAARQGRVINESIARSLSRARTIGRHVGLGGPTDMEIIGVIADTKYNGIRDPIPNTIYLPDPGPNISGERTLHKHAGRPGEHRRRGAPEISALDRNLPAKISPSRTWMKNWQERLIARFLASSGPARCWPRSDCTAMAYNVQRRTQIGIRMSMGAGRPQVLWMVAREALGLIAAGVRGLPAALAASCKVSSMLFGLTLAIRDDAWGDRTPTVTGLLAAFIPAYRASRVDPMVALRYE